MAKRTTMASTMLGVSKPAKVRNKDRAMGPVRGTSRTNKAPHDKVLLELALMRAPNGEASKTPVRTESVDQVNRTRQANRTLVHTSKPDQANRTPATTEKVVRVNRTPVLTDKAERVNRIPATLDKADQTTKTPRVNNHSKSHQMTVHTNRTRRVLRNNNPLPTRRATMAIRATLRLRTARKATTKQQVHRMAM